MTLFRDISGLFSGTVPGSSGTVTSVNGDAGPVVVLDGSEIDSTHTAVNYTPTGADIDGQLAGIDSALGAIPDPFIFKGAIAVAADFPTLGSVQNGWFFRITADVTDNDVTKTNTGQSFIIGDDIAWDGSGWIDIGPEIARSIIYDNAVSGLAATNVQDAIDETVASIPSAVEDTFTPTLSQTVFALSSTPSGPAAFALYLNGQLRLRGTDYTQAGTVLTWLDPAGVTLLTTDELIARYNDVASSGGSALDPLLFNTHSVALDGVNDVLTIPATADLQFERTDSFSFSFWFRPTSSATQTIWSAELTSGTFRGVAIRLFGQKIRLILTNTTLTNQLSVETTGDYNLSQWQHVVITYDGSSSASGVTIYRDNSVEALTTITDNLSATISYTAGIRIGARLDNNLFYQGRINKTAIFDAELDAADVAELFVQRSYMDYSTLTKAANRLHQWGMGNNTVGLIIKDEAGSVDATIANNPGGIVSEAP